MTRIAWGKPGERLFEGGVDRGVLYLMNETGVPWNGLRSVNEAPEGGVARPFYLDGYKYLNVASSEDFKATISALYSPKEFDACEGIHDFTKGLYAAQQRRKPFNLSYRTLLGNDISGLDHGYKIHLIYNALVAPSTRNNVSLSNSASANEFSWPITTRAPYVDGLRPTSHFIIDSKKTPQRLLDKVEDILYGTASTAAIIPSVEDLIGLFNTYTDSGYGAGPYGVEPYGI